MPEIFNTDQGSQFTSHKRAARYESHHQRGRQGHPARQCAC
jgi:hypothetical protein